MRIQSVGNAPVIIATFRKFVCDQINDTFSTYTMINLTQTRPSWEAESFSPLTYPNNSTHLTHTKETTGPQTTTPIYHPLPAVRTPEK